jgi:hypothetical protein
MTLLLLHHKIKKCQIQKINKGYGQPNKTYFFYNRQKNATFMHRYLYHFLIDPK